LVSSTSEHVGKNEALFREVNERIREASEGFFASEAGQGVEFVCKCSKGDCYQAVELNLQEYESVRSDPTHFLVAPGHVWHSETERQVVGNDRHWVVEKVFDAGRIAGVADPRS
jgi:hypothetical protein